MKKWGAMGYGWVVAAEGEGASGGIHGEWMGWDH